MLAAYPDGLDAPALLRKCPPPDQDTVEACLLTRCVVVGQKGDPPFCFPDDRSLSRRHFRILVDRHGNCYAEDLQSTNGLFINGRPVLRRRLVHGDSIHAGKQDWVFHDGEPLEAGDLEDAERARH